MEVEELRAAARSGRLAEEPEPATLAPRPMPPGVKMDEAFAKLGKAFAKTVEAVKLALDNAWTQLTGEVGPEGYGASQLMASLTIVLTKEQVVPTAVGPVKVDIPRLDVAEEAVTKMTEAIERLARASGSSVEVITDAVTKLHDMAGTMTPAEKRARTMEGLAGPSEKTTILKTALDAREMFGEGALYANGKRIGRIDRATGTVGTMGGPPELKVRIDTSGVSHEETTALLEVRLGTGKLELRLGSAIRGVVDKTIPLDKSWVDSVLGAIKDDRDWEHTFVLADE